MKSKDETINLLKSSSQYVQWHYDQDVLEAKFNKRRLEVYHVNLRKFCDSSNFHHIGITEENKVLNSFISDFISETCKIRKIRMSVEGTAITYFKRWFLKKTFLNHDPKQIALTSLYLACKVEEVPSEVIKQLSDYIKRDIKVHLIHFNSENYGKAEKELIEYLNFDLKVYTVFSPLTSILNFLKEKISDQQIFKIIEDECYKLARKSFFDHLIFKYTHGAIALSIFDYVLKKRNMLELSKIIVKNDFVALNLEKENEIILLQIENELKIFEKIEPKNLHNEARIVLQQAKELYRKAKMLETAGGGFQKPIEKPNALKRQNSSSNQNNVQKIEDRHGMKVDEKENKEYEFVDGKTEKKIKTV